MIHGIWIHPSYKPHNMVKGWFFLNDEILRDYAERGVIPMAAYLRVSR